MLLCYRRSRCAVMPHSVRPRASRFVQTARKSNSAPRTWLSARKAVDIQRRVSRQCPYSRFSRRSFEFAVAACGCPVHPGSVLNHRAAGNQVVHHLESPACLRRKILLHNCPRASPRTRSVACTQRFQRGWIFLWRKRLAAEIKVLGDEFFRESRRRVTQQQHLIPVVDGNRGSLRVEGLKKWLGRDLFHSDVPRP